MSKNESNKLEKVVDRTVIGTLTWLITGATLIMYGYVTENNAVSTAGFVGGLIGGATLVGGAIYTQKEYTQREKRKHGDIKQKYNPEDQ